MLHCEIRRIRKVYVPLASATATMAGDDDGGGGGISGGGDVAPDVCRPRKRKADRAPTADVEE